MENIATIFIVEGAKNLVSKANNREQKMVKLIVARCLGVMSNPQLGIFTHMASSHVNLLVRNKISKQAKKEGVYIKKVVHLPKDLFGKSTWPPFQFVLKHQYGSHVNTPFMRFRIMPYSSAS